MRNVVIGVVLATVATTSAGAESAPAASPPAGAPCAGVWVSSPLADDAQSGLLAGGPLVAFDQSDDISMRCSIQVGATNDAHSGGDAFSVASRPSPGVTAIPPTQASYDLALSDQAYLCTEATVGAVTYYWDAAGAGWSTSSAAACDYAPAPLHFVEWLLYAYCGVDLCPTWWIEMWLCAVTYPMAGRYPGFEVESDGDVKVFGEAYLDCRPYDEFPPSVARAAPRAP